MRQGSSPDSGYATVYIDPEDDVASVCGKVDAAAYQRVVVIAPKGSPALGFLVGMALLRRHAQATGKEVFVVSRRRRLRSLARQEGLATAARVSGLRLDAAPPARLRLPLGGGRRLAFPSYASIGKGMVVGAGGAAAVAAAYLLLPSASVVVYPPTVSVSKDFTVIADAGIAKPDAASLTIPARRLTAPLSLRLAVPVSGNTFLGEQKAGGIVTFRNRSGRPLTVPAGTEVSTLDGVRFVTQAQVSLAATDRATADASIVAVTAGTQGNVTPATITRVEGDLQGLVEVTNPAPTAGGSDRETSTVVQADLDRLRDLAAKVLAQQGLEAITAQRLSTDTLYQETLRTRVTEERFSHALGAETEWVMLSVEAEATALAFRLADVTALASRLLGASVSEDAFVIAETVEAKSAAFESYLADAGRLFFRAQAQGQVAPSLDREAIRRELRGRDPDTALALLSRRHSPNAPPVVRLTPSWLPRFPQVDWRINVQVKVAPGGS